MSSAVASKMSLWNQIKTFERRVFLMVWMEALERFAYYGVRMVVPIYIVASTATGGLEFTHIEKGSIYFWWAAVQSLLPVFTGNFADRYGYKKTIALAIILKVIGYGMMASLTSYGGFLAGCLFLATGTAIFKPGVQGVLGNVLPAESRSVGWGLFYQFVNIGAMFAPLIAALRFQSWEILFWGCAAAVSLNLFALPFFEDPELPEEKKEQYKVPDSDPEKNNLAGAFLGILGICLVGGALVGALDGSLDAQLAMAVRVMAVAIGSSCIFWATRTLDDRGREPWDLVVEAARDIMRPRLALFIIAFSFFWLGFTQFFDVLPNYIEDWVDSSGLLGSMGKAFALPGVPYIATALAVGVAGFVAWLISWMGLRPDLRSAEEVPSAGYVPVMGVSVFVAWLFSSQLECAAAYALGVGLFIGYLLMKFRLPSNITVVGLGLASALGMALYTHPLSAGAAEQLAQMAADGQQIPQEWLININPISISLLTVFVSYMLGFFRPLLAIIIGMIIASLGIGMLAGAHTGGIILIAVAIFTVGEMTCSPKKMEYLSFIAPPGEQGKYMGYANMPTAIGWMLGAKLMGSWYEYYGDKVNLAKKHLSEAMGMSGDEIDALQKDDVLPTLAEKLGVDVSGATQLLLDTYNPGKVWIWLAAVGASSIVLMVIYDRWVRWSMRRQES